MLLSLLLIAFVVIGFVPAVQRALQRLRLSCAGHWRDLRDELDAFGRTPAPIRIESERRAKRRRR